MPKDMNLSVNGQSQVPPGFRFHPTEEELLHYYLKKKVGHQKIDLDVIRDVDLNKLEPWDIQEKCRIGTTPQNDWYFFSHKDKKYPTGTRTNRATAAGFWKATGRDKVISSNCKRIGMRKTLVFYKGRAPHGQKSDWIMHEYRLDDNSSETEPPLIQGAAGGESCTNSPEEGWVVCRIFKKKNYHKALEGPQNPISCSADEARNSTLINPRGILDQILVYMGRSCKQENHPEAKGDPSNHSGLIDEQNMQLILKTAAPSEDGRWETSNSLNLPGLESSPAVVSVPASPQPTQPIREHSMRDLLSGEDGVYFSNNIARNFNVDDEGSRNGLSDWVTLDRLVAYQLNGNGSRLEPFETSSSGAHFSSTYDYPRDHLDVRNRDPGFLIHRDQQGLDLQSSVQPRAAVSGEQMKIRLPHHHQLVYDSEAEFWNLANRLSSSFEDPLHHLSA